MLANHSGGILNRYVMLVATRKPTHHTPVCFVGNKTSSFFSALFLFSILERVGACFESVVERTLHPPRRTVHGWDQRMPRIRLFLLWCQRCQHTASGNKIITTSRPPVLPHPASSSSSSSSFAFQRLSSSRLKNVYQASAPL